MKNITLFLGIFLPFLLFSQTGTQSTDYLIHDTKTRDYIIYVPQSYDGQTEVPLLLNLHGYTSNMEQQLFYGDFRKIADTANFILVVPNGLKDASNQRHWNFYDPSGEDDLGFLSALIDKMSNTYAIDESRVYSTGMSNGGFMSLRMACAMSEKLTAVASVTGSMLNFQLPTCTPEHPMPVMQIHGSLDATVPYLGTIEFASVPSVIDKWVQLANCNSTPTVTQMPDISTTDGSTAEHYLYEGGEAGTTIEHFKIINGGHTWPGSAFIPTGLAGSTNQDIDASKEIWRFFSQYPKTGELGTPKEEIASLLRVYPNPSNGTLTIDFEKNFDKLILVSSEGKVVRELNQAESVIKIEGLDAGIYFIQAERKGQVTSKKVVVL